MSTLTKEQLKLLDARLEQGIPKDLLASIPKNVAIMSLLRFYEDKARFYNPRLLNGEVIGWRELTKQGQDSMHFAMWWIHRYCSPNAPISAIRRTNEQVYILMHEIMEKALGYSRAWDYMGMLWRETHFAEHIDENTVELSYLNSDIEQLEIVDQLLNGPDLPISFDAPVPSFNLDAFLREANPRRAGKGFVEYSFPKSQFKKMRQHFEKLTDHLWTMPQDWDLGGYTFSEFRAFWITLVARASVHQMACYYSGVEGVGLDSLVEIKSIRHWIDELTMRSELPMKVVRQLITDLTYDSNLYDRPKKPNPNILQQPFFGVASETLAFGNQLAIGSNADRNMWSLIGIIRQPLQDKLKNGKEDQWLKDLRVQLEQRELQVFGPFKFKFKSEESDLDAFIFDSKNNYAFVVQLKWHVAPDRINEIAHTAEELNDGIRQSLLAMKWIAEQPEDLAKKCSLEIEKLKACKMRPLVLSKNMMGTGKVVSQEVPVCSERLFNFLLLDPHRKSLETLWQVLMQKRYLPQLGKHYDESDADFEFNGVRIIGKRMGMTLISQWNAEVDINFEGLTE